MPERHLPEPHLPEPHQPEPHQPEPGPPEEPRFRVLGPLEVLRDGRESTPRAPKVRQVLALLVVRANQIVDSAALTEELWGDAPPRSAPATVQTYVYHLRRFFQREGITGAGEQILHTRPPGYLLALRPEQVDLREFHRLARQGRALAERGHTGAAATSLRAALGLWRGRPLTNVRPGPRLAAYLVDLEAQRMAALRLRIQVDLELGQGQDLVGELRSLAVAHPFDEWLHARLIEVLLRGGRRGDALEVYRRLRHTLGQELGLDPSPDLRELHRAIVTRDVVAQDIVRAEPRHPR